MKYYFEKVAIEVTRKCNMYCAHCLRGDAENIDIDTSYIDKLLSYTSGIGCILFTGGEPSLNISAIKYTLEKCKQLKIPVDGFYIVTNGKENILELATVSLGWYAYCGCDDEMCGVALSRDIFHDKLQPINEAILRGLSFFKEDKFNDFYDLGVINEGRATELSEFEKRLLEDSHEKMRFYMYDDNNISVDSIVYLSVNGDIRTTCDSAYNNSNYTIGNLDTDSLNTILQLQYIEITGTLPI